MYYHKKRRKKDNQGFTLLFSILVSVLVLSIGASIISTALRQNILSGTGRESQHAFYAANTGIECAMYWDLNSPEFGAQRFVFPFTGSQRTQNGLNSSAPVNCGGGNIVTGSGFPTSQSFTKPWTVTENGGNGNKENVTTFRIAINNNVNSRVNKVLYCSEVTVRKTYNSSTSKLTTLITSQGFSNCDPAGNPNTVQRGLEFRYEI